MQKSFTLSKITAVWKNEQAIRQWEINIFEDAEQLDDFELDITRSANSEIINANIKFKRNYYKQLERKFANFVTEEKNLEIGKKNEARRVIQQR